MNDAGTAVAEAATLVRAGGKAALANAQRGGDGRPFASLVLVACDCAGRPLMLLSELAEHTKNLRADARAALLYDGTGAAGLAGPRVTLLGRAEPTADPDALAGYLDRHAEAGAYAGFRDFALWRFAVEEAHLVAGFGRIVTIAGAALMTQSRAPYRA